MSIDSPIDILCSESENLNPAIIMADELMRRDAAELLTPAEIGRAEEVLRIGASEIQAIEGHLSAFARTRALPSTQIPSGF